MPISWFIVPYKRRPDFNSQVLAWSATEVLGQQAIVKVNATSAVLTSIAGTAGFQRIPVARLDDPLSGLTNQQKNAIRNRVLALGYTVSEIDAALPGDLGQYTLRQLLLFIARRRRKVRYDEATDSIIDDGQDQPVRPVEHVDADVQ
jgi:hypothetical protein